MQCPNCGSETKNSNKCTKCNFVINKAQLELEEDFTMDRKQKEIGLSKPPRKVPLFFKITCFSPITMMITCSIVCIPYYALHSNDFTTKNTTLVFQVISAVLLLVFIAMGYRRIKLLKKGTVVMPELYKRTPYGSTFSSTAGLGGNSGANIYRGWSTGNIPNGSQKYKHYYRLTGNGGKVHEFTIKGYKDQGEFFLFNKENPKEFRRVGKYLLNMKPKNGNWHAWPSDIKSYLIFSGIVAFISLVIISSIFI